MDPISTPQDSISSSSGQRLGSDGSAVAPARKRRRRTAGGGATDDCFTCRRRSVKCDRKRPYCTQCIDIGKECTGYKTTLTWGVGVASRGKLRGLSYPIASPAVQHGSEINSVAASSSTMATADTTRRPSVMGGRPEHLTNAAAMSFNAPLSPAIKDEPHSNLQPTTSQEQQQQQQQRQQAMAQTQPPDSQHSYNTSSTLPIPIQEAPTQWQPVTCQDTNQGMGSHMGGGRSHSGQPLHGLQITPMPPPLDMTQAPGSASVAGSYAESEYHTPLEYPHTPRSAARSDSMHRSMSYSWPDRSMAQGSMGEYTPTEEWPASFSHHQHQHQHQPQHHQHHTSTPRIETTSLLPFTNNTTLSPETASPSGFEGLAFNTSSNNPSLGLIGDEAMNFSALDTTLDEYEEPDDNDPSRSMSLLDTRFANPFFHIQPRVQSLMDYYSRNICPYIVAFDGADNPYRQHILQLAMHNEGLQHALAALSTNNQRMRRHGSYQMGFVEEISSSSNNGGSDALAAGQNNSTDTSEPTAEESMYKQLSIEELNVQLMSPRAAHDDSVLATLLILCLFHVSDSGFSKFKTQLAGVQKLLSLRNASTLLPQSDFTRWVEMFFIWFDVMTSTVNDREMQINRESLAMLDYSANLGALEQYSGIDGRLFKLIARLGRLNLLAQGRPVKGGAAGQRHANNATTTSYMQPSKPLIKRESVPQQPSFNAANYENFDGNGWGHPIVDDSSNNNNIDDSECAIGSDTLPSSHQFRQQPTFSSSPYNDPFDTRHDFWTEWHDVRTRLQAWQMSPTAPANPPSSSSSINTNSPPQQQSAQEAEAGQRDMVHINESFRYSALLYTERLGHPLLPSSHDQFQYLVSQALFHITALAVTSCVNKFLLWPLFMTGTECVDEGHRNIIRLRCRKIMEESGFYNNLSTLEVLERVWSEAGANVRGSMRGEQAEMSARRRESSASRTGRYGQAFRWRKAMDRVDGEYIVI